jgi:opacity protein-like surface antigen
MRRSLFTASLALACVASGAARLCAQTAGGTASPVQSTAHPFGLSAVGPVMLAGSDASAADFQQNTLPSVTTLLNQTLGETRKLNDSAMLLDPSKLKLNTLSDVRVYFIGEGAGYNNTLGFNTGGSGLATAYLLTHIHSDTARTLRAWIGFETPNRSNRQCGGIPPAGKWDAGGGDVWINGQPLPAPTWQRPGQFRYAKPTWGAPANEIPLTDEEFYWTREPTGVPLKAGWNTVLLRTARAYDGQNWTATFLPVRQVAGRWVEDESPRFSAAAPTAPTR